VTGTIPETIGDLSKLQILWVKFYNSIELIGMKKLTSCHRRRLAKNKLHGSIPDSLANLTQLQEL
jgi:Leucine-rich repeat (LRR) protein